MPTRIVFAGGEELYVEPDIEQAQSALDVAPPARVAFEDHRGTRVYVSASHILYLEDASGGIGFEGDFVSGDIGLDGD
jgi:hypothetical protein